MADPSETSAGNINNNSNFATAIQPTRKLGGRGTPRRKTRRLNNNNNHAALVAARTLETKLKPFRAQYQLYDQQELCDITILYDDGHVDVQKQVRVHSTRPMTLHEIDSSETGVQTYNINDLDSESCEYLFGNLDSLNAKLYPESIPSATQAITTANASNYLTGLQQRQFYSQPSHHYLNYTPYQYYPYGYNSYDSYTSNIRQIYGDVNEKSEEEENEPNPVSTKSKRRRRRHKHQQKTSEQLSLTPPPPATTTREDEMIIDKPIEHLEKENITTEKVTKSKRRRIRKSKKSFRISSETGVKIETSINNEQPELNNEVILSLSSSPLPPIQFTEQDSLHVESMKQPLLISTECVKHANRNTSTEHVTNVLNKRKKRGKRKEKEELQPRNSSRTTTDISYDDWTSNISENTNIVDIPRNNDIPIKTSLPIVNTEIISNVSKNQNPSAIIISEHENKPFNQNVSVQKNRNRNKFNDQQKIKLSNSQKQSLSGHSENVNTPRTSDINKRSFSNKKSDMNDERSTTESSLNKVCNQSSSNNATSTTIKDNSERSQSTTTPADIVISDDLSTKDSHASINIRKGEHCHATSRSSLSEADNVTKNLTIIHKKQSDTDLAEGTHHKRSHLLHVENINKPIGSHLNPDAPDFKPSDTSSTYHSDLIPRHSQRRATHVDSHRIRHPRTRYYSDTYHYPESSSSIDTSTIRPLLSIVPQYIPYDPQSWNAITPLPSSENVWRPHAYNDVSNTASSYCSRPPCQNYSPLMQQQQQSLSDVNHFHNHHQNKHARKRTCTFSGGTFVHTNQAKPIGRQRSLSGPETALQSSVLLSSSWHLDGIHSLTRIMVDILRNINQVSDDQKQKYASMSSTNTVVHSLTQNKYQQPSSHSDKFCLENDEKSQKSVEAENDLVDYDMSTNALPLLPLLADGVTAMLGENETLSTNREDNQQKQISSSMSNDTNEKSIVNTSSTCYDITDAKESIKPMSNTLPEPSNEEQEKEKSSNQTRYMVKNVEDENQHKQNQTNTTFALSSSSSEPRRNTTTSLFMINRQQTHVPESRIPIVNDTTSMSAVTTHDITTTSIENGTNKNNNINSSSSTSKRDEQCVDATLSVDERAVMATANVDDGSENQRDGEKGEREKRDDSNRRTPASTMAKKQEKTEERERAKQANKYIDSVTSFTSEQHSCPSVVRLSVDDSMANRVSASSFNKNNNRQNISSSNNRSSRSTLTTHTYASTNTVNTEPIYTTTPITGDPRTLHSYYVSSQTYRPPSTSPTNSLTRHHREYEPSYPSISRYRTPSSTSPYRKAHYLDDSDEEIINEEILEITDMNHYPTLMERWGDDTKPVVREDGELKFEDFVEFEETEPTVVEEIFYELVYSGDNLKTCRQIHRSRSESRNFRKIKKRRTRRKRQTLDGTSTLTSQPSSRDTSGTRSPYKNDNLISPERSTTPIQSTLSASWQSTGFLAVDKSSLDISIRNRSDDQNYVNYVRVNESDPVRSHTQVQQVPQTRITTGYHYPSIPIDTKPIAERNLYTSERDSTRRDDNLNDTDLFRSQPQVSHTRVTTGYHYPSIPIDTKVIAETNLYTNEHDSTRLDNNLNDTGDFVPIISEERGVTKINITPTNNEYRTSDLLSRSQADVNQTTYEISSSDGLLTSTRTTDNIEQSRTTINDQTSAQREINDRELDYSQNREKQINKTIMPTDDELEKDDEEPSSTTEQTIREISGRDTDEDASFSENEQIPSESFKSDEKQKTIEDSHPSLLLSSATNEKQDDHEIQPTITQSSINELESKSKSTHSIVEPPETIIHRENIQRIQTTDIASPGISIETTRTFLENIDTQPIEISVSKDEKISSSSSKGKTSDSIDESNQDLRSFMNTLTTHLMPGLPTSFDDETEDEHSFVSETKSSEEPVTQDEQVLNSTPRKSIEDAKDIFDQSFEEFSLEKNDEIKAEIDGQQDNSEPSSSLIPTMETKTSTFEQSDLDNRSSTTHEAITLSKDSLVNVVEQMKSQDEQHLDQDEPDRFSSDSSATTTEISATQLQTKQILIHDTEDVTQKQPLTVNDVAQVTNETNYFQSPLEKEKIITDTQEFIEPITQHDTLHSIESTIESNQYVIKLDEVPQQLQQQQQQPVSSTLSGTDETIKKPTSNDDQSSVEFQSKQEADEQKPFDSSVDIVRQMGPAPQIIRLPSTDNKTETTHILQHEIEKPLVDSHVDIVSTSESIPSELVTTKEDQPEYISYETMTESIREIITAITIPSEQTSDITTRQQQQDEHVPEVQTTSSTSLDLPATETTCHKTVEDHVNEQLTTNTLTTTSKITEQTASADYQLAVGDLEKTGETERPSLDVLTEATREIITTKASTTTIDQPSVIIKTDAVESVDFVPSTSTTIEKINKVTIPLDENEISFEIPTRTTTTEQNTFVDKYEEKPLIENLASIIHEIPTKLISTFTTHEDLSTAQQDQEQDLLETVKESVQQHETPKFDQPQIQEIIQTVTDEFQPETRIEKPEIGAANLITPDNVQQASDSQIKAETSSENIGLDEPTRTTFTIAAETTNEQPETTSLSSLNSTETVPEPLVMPLAADLPIVGPTVTPKIEEKQATPKTLIDSFGRITGAFARSLSGTAQNTEGKTIEKTDINPEAQQPLSTSSLIESVGSTTSDTQQESSRDDNLPQDSSKVSSEVGSEILVSPILFNVPTADHKLDPTIETELRVPQPSIDSLTQIIAQLTTIESAERKTYVEQTTYPYITEETTIESSPASTADVTNQDELEHVKSTTVIEAPSSDILAELNKQLDNLQISMKRTQSEETQEHENEIQNRQAEPVQMQPLTETASDIHATPAATHQQGVPETALETPQTEYILGTPSLSSVTDTTKQVEIESPTDVTTTHEEKTESLDVKEDQLQQPITTSSDTKIIEEITKPDQQPILSETTSQVAVPQIIERSLISRTTTDQHILERTIEIPSTQETITTTEVTTIHEHTVEPTTATEEVVQQQLLTSVHTEIVEDSKKEAHQPVVVELKTELADCISADALSDAVREIIAAPVINDIPTDEHILERPIEVPPTEEQITTTQVTITQEETVEPVPVTEEVLHQPLIKAEVSQQPLIKEEVLQQPLVTQSHLETVEDSKKKDDQPIVLEPTTEIADRASTDALTDAVRETTATQVASDIPTDEHVIKRAVEVPLKEETITTTELTSTQEERLQSVAVTEEVLHQALVTITDTETVEDSKKEDHQPVVLEPTTELADRVSTDALTDIVRKIIGTPVISDIPTQEHVIERAIEVPSTEEKISTTEVTTTQEATVQPVAVTEHFLHQPLVTEEVSQQPLVTPSHLETVEDSKEEHYQPVVLEPTTELADRVSADALTDAVREIIGTPVISDIPTDEHVIDRAVEVPLTKETKTTTELTTTQEERLPPVAVTEEILHQPLVTTTDTETVEDTKKEDRQPVVLEPTTELADRVSTDALTDIVRKIIGTPVISDIPTQEHVIEPAVEVPLTDETVTTTEVTTTQERTLEPVAETEEVLQQPLITEEVSQQPLITEEILHQPLVTSTDTEIADDSKKEERQPVVLEPK
ncbi:unnamed protein product, partial [Rotaria magnacalcarata]